MTTAMTTVRDAAFAVFDHFGIDALFGNPGSTELPMLAQFPDTMDYVLGLNEAVVIGMADGYAQASGNPALVNLHSSAGTGNALGNLYTAYRNNAPIVVTAGQQARSILPFDPFLGAERPTEFPRPFVKWACEPARAQDVPLALAHAFHVAMTPPMGPTFVSVPVDDWDRECALPSLPSLTLPTPPAPEGIDALLAMLDGAQRPALVLGAGMARSGGHDAALALAEKCGADLWCSPLSARETIPENHPRFAGFLPAFRERIVEALSPNDAILVVGTQAFTYHAEGKGPHWPEGARLGLLSDDPAHLSILQGGTGVLGDIRVGLQALAERAAQKPEREAHARAAPPAPGMNDAWVLSRMAALRPEDAVIVEEAPTARGAMHDHLPVLRERGFFATASGGLGYALPASIGVARAMPEAKVLCLLGDGSAMYCAQGLWSAVKQNANVSFVILNNRKYAALDQFAPLFGMNRVPGTQLGGIDFATLAGSMGVAGRKVDDVAALDDALAWSFAADGPTLVEVAVE